MKVNLNNPFVVAPPTILSNFELREQRKINSVTKISLRNMKDKIKNSIAYIVHTKKGYELQLRNDVNKIK